ncbi:hypothetical protein E0H26_26925 [Micromonospora zingiberis]|uniref:VWA domain-containing protein n=1 Tax=Micromonospora zingiberis TaxID=2053011 RepID=A0A4R0G6E7_9ACTN|nr:hypothetical protein [Micromonospora zingiberis]TCB90461.1 hypothetical protein E0H26_26925 [Micromonospora zingiberis]
MTEPLPAFVRELVSRLRRRGLPLGIDDCAALRAALAAGHGLSSNEALRALCVTLFAASTRDAEIITSTLHLVNMPVWAVAAPEPAVGDVPTPAPMPDLQPDIVESVPSLPKGEGDVSRTVPLPRSGGIQPPRSGRPAPPFIMRPQYPLSEREIAQAWRRLRRPRRHGPRVELNVEATMTRYAATGLVTPPVLVPRRVNAARLLLLVDRHGSMTPFHGFIDHFTRSMVRASRLDSITIRYFRNSPGTSPDRSALTQLADPANVEMDAIVDRIPPLAAGWVYDDPGLTQHRPMRKVLDDLTPGSGVVVISDAGAQRGSLVTTRIFDAIALGLAIITRQARIAWLNPLSVDRWADATAEQIARHIPMFPLDRDGMYAAVDILRGRPTVVEAPL